MADLLEAQLQSLEADFLEAQLQKLENERKLAYARDYPWLEAILRVTMPIIAICRTKQSSETVIAKLSAIIDSCETPKYPARMAIAICQGAQNVNFTGLKLKLSLNLHDVAADAIALKYQITVEEIRSDRLAVTQSEQLPVDHWTRDPEPYLRARSTPRIPTSASVHSMSITESARAKQ